ncbi:MAG: response regulator [Desulfobacteraceae bacterium]|nr:response regulator [Desulfobacteraceae bacterium]
MTLDTNKILVIDDEESLRDGAQRILSRLGFTVFLASTGQEGLDILDKEPAGIVLLDLKMPGMDGMEVLKKIAAIEKNILVIVITGYATVETAIEAMKIGAYDFIPKPYEPDQLRIVVNRAKEKLGLEQSTINLAKKQQETLTVLHTERSRTHTIIESLPNGVIVTNTEGNVILINPACCQYLGVEFNEENKDYTNPIDKYIKDKELCTLANNISKGKYIDYTEIPSTEIETKDGKYLLARCRPVIGDKQECLGCVVNLMDISAMKTLDLLKSEFVSKVTHELRSPLSTIHEQLDMVIKSEQDNNDQDDQYMLSRAKEKVYGLISTIGDLLDLSRIEAGASAKTQKPVNVDEVLKNITDFLNTRAKSKKQTLTLITPDQPLPTLKADAVTLESVFGNLIANAINYTQEGGKIDVTVDKTGNNIRVKVTDNGFGIEAKHMDKIFKRFYRVKNDKTRFLVGTGLGLPIVKNIVDSMNGYIEVKSEVGKGSTFTIILPLKQSEHAIM